MPSTIFTIANQKGGVGKTTTAINLSYALARQNIPTLLIDLDPQANATSGLGVEKTPGKSMYSPLHGDAEAADYIVPTSQENLFMIPGEREMAAIDIELAQKPDYMVQLKRCLAPIKEAGEYKAIILDCPPSLGLISMNSLTAADFLLVALQCEYYALEGLIQIIDLLQEIKFAGWNDNIELGGIIMTMYDVRTNLSRSVVDEVRTHYAEKIFNALIPRTVRLGEAPSHRKSIFEYDPNNIGAKSYERLGEEVAERFQLA